LCVYVFWFGITNDMLVNRGFQCNQKTALNQSVGLAVRETLRHQKIDVLFSQVDALSEVKRRLNGVE